MSPRANIDRISQAATFLQYQSSEQQLVDLILMNLDHAILIHAAFLDRPRCIKELNRVVGLIEERISIYRERLRAVPDPKGEQGGRGKPRDESRAGRQRQERAGAGAIKCWGCGQTGHYRRCCARRNSRRGNGREPGALVTPGATF